MKSNEGGLWTITLFAANEIPSVVVTFVALIMFLQMKMGVAWSTLFVAMLLLPWVMQPFMRKWLPGAVGGRAWLHTAELLIAALLACLALTMTYGKWWVWGMLMCISVLSAWHDLLAKRYYKRRTLQAEENYHTWLRAMASQASTVFTYGLMIMAVGVLQIYFRQRNIAYSWSLGAYLLSGAYMMLAIGNLVLLKSHTNMYAPLAQKWPWQRRHWKKTTAMLMLMLMPQGLMFYSRTVFLLTRTAEGGLGCTLQDIGFAQGTIGVIAFLFGVAAGRALQNNCGKRMGWLMRLCLALSPAVYLLMACCRPDNLMVISVHTFAAQLLFGLGMNACKEHIEEISGERYHNAVNPLHIPVVCLCIMLPMAVSGFLVERMSYQHFFLLDTLCGLVTWVAIGLTNKFGNE